MPEYTLPDLPYDYAALEPHISGRIMQLHHDTHHQAYVTGANTTLEQLADAREAGSFGALNGLQRSLAFHLAGHVNHSVFWANLSPDGGGEPDGELHAALVEQFGSLQAFRAHFTAAALQLQGSGWAVLAWDSLGQRLLVEQLQDHQTNLASATVPVLLLDMWEHAYYLDYQATKADYVAAWWNIANWTDAAARLAAARAQTPGLLTPAPGGPLQDRL